MPHVRRSHRAGVRLLRTTYDLDRGMGIDGLAERGVQRSKVNASLHLGRSGQKKWNHASVLLPAPFLIGSLSLVLFFFIFFLFPSFLRPSLLALPPPLRRFVLANLAPPGEAGCGRGSSQH